MDERYYNQNNEQKAIQDKYPPINKRFEYLDHTADVQLHAWGSTLQEAFEQVTTAMFCYITDLAVVEPLQTMEIEAEAEGGDMMTLLYNFMDAWLFNFCADPFFIPRELKVISLDRVNFKIRSIGWGEKFNLDKHPQGTEVKAITYSAMQIHEEKETNDIFVIIDI